MIDLPATNDAVMFGAIDPALAALPARMASEEAKVMLLAIGRQESNFAAREQVRGPARGFWQFERGGVLRVMHHTSSSGAAYNYCVKAGVQWGSTSILRALAQDDELAAVFARLLLWTDPRPLPEIGDKLGAWDLYERCWKPGKPAYSRWGSAYEQAVESVAQ
jgi:hypothetical protein